MKIISAEFVAACRDPKSFPTENLPEAAFAGRSNAGKSSLLNCLVQRKKLARTSATPGCTQTINFYRINRSFLFADLPGYGYARVSKEERDKWSALFSSYLQQRRQLRVVMLIMDARRRPEEEEIQLLELVKTLGLAALLAAAKADKLRASERPRRREEISRGLGVLPEEVVLFSSLTGEGRQELWKRLLSLLHS